MTTSLIYDQSRKRVEQQLRKLWELMGPLSLAELSDLMDGAQDAVREWMPPEPKPDRRIRPVQGSSGVIGCRVEGRGQAMVPTLRDAQRILDADADEQGPAGVHGLGRCARCGESFRPDSLGNAPELAELREGLVHAACTSDGEELA